MGMKKFYQIHLIILFLLLSAAVYAQPYSSVVPISDGNNDKNPKFNLNINGDLFTSYLYELFVFERLLPDSSVHICALKINKDGVFDSLIYLTPFTAVPRKNINPSIAYNQPSFSLNVPRYILVIWETNQFGSSNIYGKRYIEGQGWSDAFAIDSSVTQTFTPNVVCMDSTNFAITFRKGNDIFFKKYNIITGLFTPEQNLTSTDALACLNPSIVMRNGNPANLIVTYEREINVSKRSICYQHRLAYNDASPWSAQDSISFTGNNKNAGFNDPYMAVYENNSGSNWRVKGVQINLTGSHVFHNLFANPGGDYSNFSAKYFLITDGGGPYSIHALIEDQFLNWNFANFYTWGSQTPNFQVELSEIGSNKSVSMVSSNPIRNGGNCLRYWFIFNSTLSPTMQFESRLFGLYIDNCVTAVSQIGSDIPHAYKLYQNYPNPFNPETKIYFDILQNEFVTLEVFNALGERVSLLANERLSQGSYEYNFNASDLSSGLYYYRLSAGDFTSTKKMILLK